MAHFDPRPRFTVTDAEFGRLLGFPPGYTWNGRSRQLAAWAREWFATHGRPWVFTRRVASLAWNGPEVEVEGVALRGPALQKRLRDAGATGALLVAVSAGPEAEAEASRLWLAERPDEYFFLEIFASAVVESLAAAVGARLCAEAEEQGEIVLPHYSPGYPGWELSDQPALVELIRRCHWPPGVELTVFPSGQLVPKKSLAGLFPVAPKTSRALSAVDLIPCEACAFSPCAFRRAPFRLGAARKGEVPVLEEASECGGESVPAASVGVSPTEGAEFGRNVLPEGGPPGPLPKPEPASLPLPSSPAGPSPLYATNPKALSRWARERLSLETLAGSELKAVFLFEGSTCKDMGTPLAFAFTFWLSSQGGTWCIRQLACAPAPGAHGHRAMCAWQKDPEAAAVATAEVPPIIGLTLDAALAWRPGLRQSGCLCDTDDRNHKWRLALETLHYQLYADENTA